MDGQGMLENWKMQWSGQSSSLILVKKLKLICLAYPLRGNLQKPPGLKSPDSQSIPKIYSSGACIEQTDLAYGSKVGNLQMLKQSYRKANHLDNGRKSQKHVVEKTGKMQWI